MAYKSTLRVGISPRFHYQLPTSFGTKNKAIQYLEQSIAHWIAAHNALPMMIPSLSDSFQDSGTELNPSDFASELDALILQGGIDISPELYGEAALDPKNLYDLVRDRYELSLIEAFLREKKPILGVCRGMQLLNVYFGGTLHQDLGPGQDGRPLHFEADLDEKLDHPIRFLKGGELSRLYPDSGRVVSIHHQGVKTLGQGLVVEAECPEDGLIEAFRWSGDSFALGVQWHPEFHRDPNRQLLSSGPLMSLFLERTRERRFFGESRRKGTSPSVEFGTSDSLTLGVELELQLLDPATKDLKPSSIQILQQLKDITPKVKSEIFQSMIEIETSICRNAREAETDLTETLAHLRQACLDLKVGLASAGSHPFALYTERKLFPSARYEELVERNQWIARQIMIFGLHVHVGMPDPGHAILAYKNYLGVLPLLLGLSSSSPFWHSDLTGLASARSTFFESTPTGGHPPVLDSWEQFEGLYHKLVSSGSIRSHKDLWWDLRPSPNYGTLEIRICDSMPTIAENAALAALIHVFGSFFRDAEAAGALLPKVSEWSYRENKWRATRHGLDFDFLIDDTGRTVPAKAYLLHLFEKMEPLIRRFGYESYFELLKSNMKEGLPFQRQLRVFEKENSLIKVVEHLEKELWAGHPDWSRS